MSHRRRRQPSLVLRLVEQDAVAIGVAVDGWQR